MIAVDYQRALVDAVDGFLFYLQHVRGLSSHTAFHYGHDLSMFMRYLAESKRVSITDLDVADVTTSAIEDFLNHLVMQRGNVNRSVKRRLAALRSFCAYIGETVNDRSGPTSSENNPASHIPTPRVTEPAPITLTADQAKQLLRAARSITPFPERDYAIMRLFLHCGARLSEVLELELDDIALDEAYVQLNARGRRSRAVPLSEETSSAIDAYLAVRPKVPFSRVFLSRNGTPISKGAIYYLIDRCLSATDLDFPVNVHTLRHTCFTLLAGEGFTPRELQKLAGLRRMQMPRTYHRLAKQEKPTTS